MRSQKCTSCGTLLDVSKLEKGSKFACANCGEVLIVGEAVAVKRSLKDSGPAFKPKTGKEAAAPTRSTRARADAGAPRGHARSAEKSKSPMPLLLGVGGVVVVGVVIAIVLSSSDGGGTSGTGGGGGGGTSQKSAADWWAQASADLGSRDAKALRALMGEAEARGYNRDSTVWPMAQDAIYRALLTQDPGDDAANKHMGRKALQDYPGFTKLWDQMNEHYKVLPKEYRAFLTQYEDTLASGDSVWLDAEPYAAAKVLLDSFQGWIKELEADPAAEQIQKGMAQARQIMKNAEAEPVVSRPFIVFVASKGLDGEGGEAKRAELAKRGQRYSKALAVFYAKFREKFGQPLNLEEIPTSKVFYHWVYEDKESFDRGALMGDGFDVDGEVYGYFSPKSKWAYELHSSDEQQALMLVSDICHEGLHQLHQFHSKDPDDKWENHFDRWQALWFNEGWAEYLGGGVQFDPSSETAEWTGMPRRRVAHLKLLRDTGMPRIPLRELVQQDSFEALRRWIGNWIGMLHQDEEVPDTALALLNDTSQGSLHVKTFYAQAWFLAYFMNEYDGGKYRQKYLDLVLTALRGKLKPEAYRKNKSVKERWPSAYEAFVEIMGIKGDDDWKKLQRQHDGFLKKTLRD